MNANHFAQRFGYDNVRNSEKTPEGFIVGEVIGTRTGVFEYPAAALGLPGDGSVWVCRHPDDVFEAESIRSARLAPITEDHPPLRILADGEPDPDCNGFVNSRNAAQLSRGSLGDTHRIDGDSILFPYKITHGDLVDKVVAGKRGLSMGYKFLLVPERGVFRGQAYEYRQVRIRYNHMAVVDAGRVGPTARISLDSVTALPGKKEEKKGFRMEDVIIGLDTASTGTKINYKVPPEVAAYITALDSKIGTAAKDLLAMTTARDTALGEVTAKDTKITDLEQQIKDLPATLKAGLDARHALEKKAEGWMKSEDIAKHTALDAAGFMREAIKANPKVSDAVKTALDGKPEAFLEGVFLNLPTAKPATGGDSDGEEGGEDDETTGHDSSRQNAAAHGNGEGGEDDETQRSGRDSAPKTGRDKMLDRLKEVGKKKNTAQNN